MTQTDVSGVNKPQETSNEYLKAIGRKRLEPIVPKDVRGVIVAELNSDNDCESFIDCFQYKTIRTVILGFSSYTGNSMPELRKHAANFKDTEYLSKGKKEYEHKEMYTGGSGYYIAECKYHGWTVRKRISFKDRENIIKELALAAGDEFNVSIISNLTI